MIPARPGSRALLAAFVALVAVSGCGLRHRIPGFGPERDGVLLVRHTRVEPVRVRAGDVDLGLAEPDRVTCFPAAPTGTFRLEAHAHDGTLLRAQSITLPPEQPLLWDVDHNQLLSGRAHASLCP